MIGRKQWCPSSSKGDFSPEKVRGLNFLSLKMCNVKIICTLRTKVNSCLIQCNIITDTQFLLLLSSNSTRSVAIFSQKLHFMSWFYQLAEHCIQIYIISLSSTFSFLYSKSFFFLQVSHSYRLLNLKFKSFLTQVITICTLTKK